MLPKVDVGQKAGEDQKLKGLELPEPSMSHLHGAYLLPHVKIQAFSLEHPSM